jgi:hypothetical protein
MIRPRITQIAELTRGQQLPLEPIKNEHLLVIADALAGAWNDLMVAHATTLRSGPEAEINELMRCKLTEYLDTDPLWETLVRNVVRGAETVSFDGSHLEKRPDLSIYLTGRSTSFQLVVECKLIDAPNGKSVHLYSKDGIARFIKGEYSWAVREAFMVGYVRDGSDINGTLSPYLKRHMRTRPDPYQTSNLPSSVVGRTNLSISTHGRGFSYVHQQPPSAPDSIALWHLWL